MCQEFVGERNFVTHLRCCTTTVTLKGHSHRPCIGPQSRNGAPQNWAPSDWFQAKPSSRQYKWSARSDVLCKSILPRNCTAANDTDGAARANAIRFSSSFNASIASTFACFLMMAFDVEDFFDSANIKSPSFRAAVKVTSEAS